MQFSPPRIGQTLLQIVKVNSNPPQVASDDGLKRRCEKALMLHYLSSSKTLYVYGVNRYEGVGSY